MDFIIPSGVKELGAIGLVVLAVLLFYTGKIVAGSTVDRLVGAEAKRADEAVARATRAEEVAEGWRGIAETNAETSHVLSSQVRELTEIGRLSSHMIKSVQEVASGTVGADSGAGEGFEHVASG